MFGLSEGWIVFSEVGIGVGGGVKILAGVDEGGVAGGVWVLGLG